MAVMEPEFTVFGNVEVLVAVGDAILVVDDDGVQCSAGDGKYLVLVCIFCFKYVHF